MLVIDQGIIVRNLSLLIGFAMLLVSCSTTEFREEKNICTANWMKKIPPRYEQEMYNKSYTRQVPTGQTTCTGFGNSITCNQIMRTEYYSLPAVRTVDRNKSRRDPQINACTQAKCVQKYGNSECKA